MLKKRGNLFGNGKYKEVKEIEDKIEQLVKEKEAKFSIPVYAFITFESFCS